MILSKTGKEIKSDLILHPGEVLKDEIKARGLSQHAVAEQLEMQPSVLNELCNGKRKCTTKTALLLEYALGIEAEFWLKLQMDYDLHQLRIQ